MSCYLCGRFSHYSTFTCPKDETIKNKWYLFCNLKVDSPFPFILRLCKNHFLESDICEKKTENGRTKLRKNTVPSQNQGKLDQNLKKSTTSKYCCQLCTLSGQTSTLPKSYFSFPDDPTTREKWVKFSEVQESDLPKKAKLCSLHFRPEDMSYDNSGRVIIKFGAVPVLFNIENFVYQENDQITPHNSSSGSLTEFGANLNIRDLVNDSNYTPPMTPHQFETDCDSMITPHINMSSRCCDKRKFDSAESSNSSNQRLPKRTCQRTLRYMGDVQNQDLTSPSRATQSFNLAFNSAQKYKKKIKILQRKVNRLESKIRNYKGMVDDLKKKSLLPEKTVTRLTV